MNRNKEQYQARTIMPDGYEVFYRSLAENAADGWLDEDGAPYPEGWYWWSCQPGCLPDGDAIGPFESRADAIGDCRGDA